MSLAAAYSTLIQGVNELDFSGSSVPSDLLLIGEKAFPVLVSNSGQVLIAASQYGKGRIVALVHETYLDSPQFGNFLQNAIKWLKPTTDALVGVNNTFKYLAGLLSESGVAVQSSDGFSESFGVYCMDAYDAGQKSQLIAFVKGGGGLLIAGQAWYWATTNGAENVCFGFPGNQVISVSGIYFTSNYGERGIFPVSKELPNCPLVIRHDIDISKELSLLLAGVSDLNIANEGAPSHLLVHGPLAFPIGIDEYHQSFLAASFYGTGRVVVATHERQLDTPYLKTFLLNAVTWLDAGRKGKIGVASNLPGLQELLVQNSMPAETCDLIPTLSVYCCQSYSATEAEKIHEFVAEGGGLLIGGQAWWWASQNPGLDAIAEYPGNKILHTFGICIMGRSFKADNYKPVRPEDAQVHYHFRRALHDFLKDIHGQEKLKSTQSMWLKKLGQDCAEFVKLPADDSAMVSSVHQRFKDLLQEAEIPTVSKDQPIKNNSVESVLIQLMTTLHNRFPESSHITLDINCNNPGSVAWRSTGLYIHPKRMLTVTFPLAAIGKGLMVQIGCHSDDLSNVEELYRPPLVTTVHQVTSEKIVVSNLWGGLVYILVPAGAQFGSMPITIGGADSAPYFKHGKSLVSDWLKTIRHYPVPWAEFETENLILTVPADQARAVENPDALMSVWDSIMAALTELAAIPAGLPRPERVVVDVQISAGWMHSGYPVMCHVQSAKDLLDLEYIKSTGPWGIIHELGHNQQGFSWNFRPNTTEATCNLWSVYVSEKVLGIQRSKAHASLQDSARNDTLMKYIQKGARLEDWTVWTALETYLQLQEGFGWQPFIQLFSDYQKMTDIKNDNTYKMNLWAELFSNQVKRNLAPFFKTWGWPIEDSTNAKLQSLPEWEENPMKKFALK